MKKKFLNTWLFALILYNKNINIIKYINISICYCNIYIYIFTIPLILEHFFKLKKIILNTLKNKKHEKNYSQHFIFLK